MNNSEKETSDLITRSDAIKRIFLFLGAGLLCLFSPKKKAHAGYGRCSLSGCPCGGYVQTYGSDLCNNCGHPYSAHW
jgi:hypothetical protein